MYVGLYKIDLFIYLTSIYKSTKKSNYRNELNNNLYNHKRNIFTFPFYCIEN